MKRFFLCIAAALVVVSCGTSKPVTTSKKYTPAKSAGSKTVSRDLESEYAGKIGAPIKNLLKDAEKYLGSPYKYGGNTSSGFDCSGFTAKVFEENDYRLPRRSSDQAEVGEKVAIQKVRPGDLLFFATSGGVKVSHVGIVHDISSNGEIKFIHASTSKGVIISSLSENYWNKTFLHAQRVL
ncbi:MAG: C40 family peptidase [Bergeyella sp.]